MISIPKATIELFNDLDPQSKVWLYASDRLLSEIETEQINERILTFTKQWTAHDVALKGTGKVIFNRFIVLAVDESHTNASGCSIDKSVHFIKGIEKEYGLNLFDRLKIYYQQDNGMNAFHFNDLKDVLAKNQISEDTLIFDTTITKLDQLQIGFVKEASKSWLGKFMN